MGDPHVQLVALGEYVEAVAAICCGAGDVTDTVAGGNRVHESAMERGAVGVAHGAVDDSADGHVHVVRGGCRADGHDLSLGDVTSVAPVHRVVPGRKPGERKSVGTGKGVAVRVDVGGGRIIKK